MSSDSVLAPNKKAREVCWSFRDKLFDCLDKHNEDLSKCTEEVKGVENNCSKMWSKYFLKRRNYLQFREKVEKEGFQYTDPNAEQK